MKGKLRNLIFKIYCRLVDVENLFMRMEFTEIGLTGYVSVTDESMAEEYNLKPLNKFEKWLCEPVIKLEKKIRQEIWEQVTHEYLGE